MLIPYVISISIIYLLLASANRMVLNGLSFLYRFRMLLLINEYNI